MPDWKPIGIGELNNLIHESVREFDEDILLFWQAIKVVPTKWQESEFGTEGGGFWAVAICDNEVVWYNDIEEGFNLSRWQRYGEIPKCAFEQDELKHALKRLYDRVQLR